jgi:hypothetical protein
MSEPTRATFTAMHSGFLVGFLVLAATAGGYHVGLAQTGAPPSGNVAASAGAPATFAPISEALAGAQVIAAKASSLGYVAKVAPGEFGRVDVIMSRTGKTEETFGLLRQKWDQRETISLSYVPTDMGLRLAGAKRQVEQKPPVGQWKIVTDNDQIPPDLLVIPPAQ